MQQCMAGRKTLTNEPSASNRNILLHFINFRCNMVNKMLFIFIFVLGCITCDSIPIVIIEVRGGEYKFGKWRIYKGGKISVTKDTVCVFRELTNGMLVEWCEPDSCKLVRSMFYHDSIYTVLQEE